MFACVRVELQGDDAAAEQEQEEEGMAVQQQERLAADEAEEEVSGVLVFAVLTKGMGSSVVEARANQTLGL